MEAVKKRGVGPLRRKEMRAGYLMILPMLAGLLAFSVVPFFQNIYYSFRRMGSFDEGVFVGISNYTRLLTDPFFKIALGNTFFYALIGTPMVVIFSVLFAYLLNKPLRGRTIYRTLMYIPAVVIPAAIGILWTWILNYQYGILNQLIMALGMERVSFLGDVRFVRWSIILVLVWSMVAQYTIIILAGMQSVDESYYEAAKIDGARTSQIFFRITLPLVSPIIFFTSITIMIGILQIFDFIYLMVDRNSMAYNYSMSLVTYFYENAFNKTSMRGYGAAIAVVLMLIILLITAVQFYLQRFWVNRAD